MPWGAPRGVDDLIEKLRCNKTAKAMCILSTRTFGATEAVAFADALGRNTSLHELLASGHPIGASGASAFGKAMSLNTSLRYLCIGDNMFGDEGLSALVDDGLKTNVGLLVLDLEHKSISSGKALCSLLLAHHTLEDLRLGRNRLGELALNDIAQGLSQNSRLRRLDLSSNILNAAAAEALGRAISAALSNRDAEDGDEVASGVFPPLEYLDVSRNPLGDEGGAALFRALSSCPMLRCLNVAETGLGIAALTSLAEALAPTGVEIVAEYAERNTAQHIAGPSVRSSEEHAEGISKLAIAERQPVSRGAPLIASLDLSKNNLGSEGVTCLADAFRRGGAPRLKFLSLGYNDVGDEGARVIAAACGESLQVVNLGGNALSGAGIASALSAPGLREAKLFHNACGDEGVALVLEALRKADHLETLDLGANRLSGAGFEALLPELTHCSSLRTLELGANCNDERAEAAVRESQTTNPGLDIAFRRGGEAMEGSGMPPPGSQISDVDLMRGSSFSPKN